VDDRIVYETLRSGLPDLDGFIERVTEELRARPG